MELKKRIHTGICAASGCNVKENLYHVPLGGREIDVCSTHALELPDEDTAIVPVAEKKPRAKKAEAETSAVTTVDLKQLQADSEEANSTLVELSTFEIVDETDLKFAADMLAEVKGKYNSLDEQKKRATDPINRSLKEIREWFKPALDALAKIEGALKEKVSAYTVKQAEEKQLSIEMLSSAQTAEEREAALAKIGESETTKVSGLVVSQVWTFEIEDEGLLPRLYLSPNEKMIRAQIELGVRTIPGVRIFQKPQIASRAS